MDKYCIIYKSSTNSLPIGDLFRVLFLLKNKKKILLTDKYNFKNFNKFKDIKLDYFKNLKKYQKNFKIINLYLGYKIKETFFDINRYIKKKISKKITYDVFNNLIKLDKQKPKKHLLNRKKIKVGINWQTPAKWNIKSYPMEKWNKLVKMCENEKNIDISWQKGKKLSEYIEWVNSCDIIVSIVGLGTHISSYLEKKTILLVGPTDFYESSLDYNIKKICPSQRCKVHKKKINLFYKHCSCMNNINEIKIFKELKNIIKAN